MVSGLKEFIGSKKALLMRFAMFRFSGFWWFKVRSLRGYIIFCLK